MEKTLKLAAEGVPHDVVPDRVPGHFEQQEDGVLAPDVGAAQRQLQVPAEKTSIKGCVLFAREGHRNGLFHAMSTRYLSKWSEPTVCLSEARETLPSNRAQGCAPLTPSELVPNRATFCPEHTGQVVP